MTRRRVQTALALAAAVALTAAACGDDDSGGSGSPTAPTGGGGGGGSAMTITIGADGRVSPSSITVPVGSRVTFVNNHNRAHEMASDPHPEHTQCPEITVGNLQPNQNRQTQPLTTARSCGFHDHTDPTNSSLQGTIRIQ